MYMSNNFSVLCTMFTANILLYWHYWNLILYGEIFVHLTKVKKCYLTSFQFVTQYEI